MIKPGCLIIGLYNKNSYRIINLIGRGNIGEVYKIEDENGNIKALKISRDLISITKEYKVLSKLKYEKFIPNVFDLDDTILYNTIYHYIVIEYIEGKNLSYYIKHKINFHQIIFIANFLCDFLMYLSNKNLYYTDLKPENIILQKESCYIVDFGSVIESGESIKEFTPAYDRASWGMGKRAIDSGYMVFQIAMIMANLLLGKVYEPHKLSINYIRKEIKIKFPNSYYAIFKGLNGDYTIAQFKRDLLFKENFIFQQRLNYAMIISGLIFLILLNIALRG